MCITVGGAKRNWRIGISQLDTKTKGRRPFAERSQCRGRKIFRPYHIYEGRLTPTQPFGEGLPTL
ncbi:MAG: hypothetical protein LBU34_04690 [Planctomycetaceae bacterium]|nr:hypothetical protein [Planctomycetaceae bacterium]